MLSADGLIPLTDVLHLFTGFRAQLRLCVMTATVSGVVELIRNGALIDRGS
jgi:hypothetical protein